MVIVGMERRDLNVASAVPGNGGVLKMLDGQWGKKQKGQQIAESCDIFIVKTEDFTTFSTRRAP